MASKTEKKNNLSREDIANIIKKTVKYQGQNDRSQILEMLLEIDRDKTEVMINFEKLRNEINEKLHELEKRRIDEHKESSVRCRGELDSKFEEIDTKIKTSKPNYFAIIGLILSLLLPALGWVYSLQQAIWDVKVDVVASQAVKNGQVVIPRSGKSGR